MPNQRHIGINLFLGLVVFLLVNIDVCSSVATLFRFYRHFSNTLVVQIRGPQHFLLSVMVLGRRTSIYAETSAHVRVCVELFER